MIANSSFSFSAKKYLCLSSVAFVAMTALLFCFGCSGNSGVKFKLEGHTSMINSLAFSPDGKFLATGSSDKTVKLWSTADWKAVRTFTGHEYPVIDVVFSPDGRLIASSGYYISGKESRLIIWEAATGREVLNIKQGPGSFARLAFSTDGNRILTNGPKEKNGFNYPIKALDVSTGSEVLSANGPDKSILAIAYSRDGKNFFVTDFNRNLSMYDAATGQSLYRVMAHSGSPAGLALSRDGKYVVTGCGSFDYGKLSSYKIVMRDLVTGNSVKEFEGDGHAVNCVDISPDGRYVLSGGLGKAITLWDVASGKDVTEYKDNKGTVCSVQFSPDGKYIASSAFSENVVKIWGVPAGK